MVGQAAALRRAARHSTESQHPGSDMPGEFRTDHTHTPNEVYLGITAPSHLPVLCPAISALCTLNFSMLSSCLCPSWPVNFLESWSVSLNPYDQNGCDSSNRYKSVSVEKNDALGLGV